MRATREVSIRLRVARAHATDAGRDTARVSQRVFDELELAVGDVLEMRGSRTSAFRALPARPENRALDVVHLDGLQRTNAGVGIGEYVVLSRIEPPEARLIRLASVERGGPASERQTLPHDELHGRPLSVGDMLSVAPQRSRDPFGERRYLVLDTTPPGTVVVVGESTRIHVEVRSREPSLGVTEPSREWPVSMSSIAESAFVRLDRPGRQRTMPITYGDLGGLDGAINQIREMVELPLKHPELFSGLGIEPPRGVLLHGPPGTGKTLLARAVAHEADVTFLHVAGPEIMGSLYGESEGRLREIFDQARAKQPAIVFIDEIDSIALDREKTRGDVERRVVAQLLSLMDGLERLEGIMVLAATNRVDTLDEALRRPGRFDREIAVGAPDWRGRKRILEIHTRGIPLDEVDLEALARTTHGFVGADIAALVQEAVMEGLRRSLRDLDPGDDDAVRSVAGTIRITAADFRGARARVSPSALREIHVEVAQTGWDDVGGLEDVKDKLREGIELPLRQPEAFHRFGIRPPRGLLLFGPPGTGKTLLGRAVAGAAEANFILARSSSLLSRWYGESERQVSRIFARARRVAPAIIFIDEIDALAPRRTELTGEPAVTERVVNTLLAEMDGIEAGEGVVVIGATNRPLRLDPALLRPGRFDELLFVPLPDHDARLHILRVHTRAMPLGRDVDLEDIADRTDGFTGADLEDLVRRAGIAALRESAESGRIDPRFLERALSETRASVTPEVANEYEQISKTLRQSAVRVQERIGF